MVNTALLKDAIINSGLKKEYIAKEMGLTRQSLGNKLNGRSDFWSEEIIAICEILGITDPVVKDSIFFASK